MNVYGCVRVCVLRVRFVCELLCDVVWLVYDVCSCLKLYGLFMCDCLCLCVFVLVCVQCVCVVCL